MAMGSPLCLIVANIFMEEFEQKAFASAQFKPKIWWRHADLNLMEEIVLKDQDLISTEVPVYDNRGQLLGSLSVTVIGNSTLQNYVKK
ncbi:hypothetical protein J6590_007638 [Homalodisca vitripennis]|nr:hypothetical protein J6590_007638 [Homalodisca vitripennis]